VNLCKELRVYCDTDGGLTGRFYADLPHERLELRASGDLDTTVTTSGARWSRLRFGPSTRARAAKIELAASAAARIYQIQVRAKALGEGLSGWRWVDVPVAPTSPGFEWFQIAQAQL
jgi:hypothetical protein